MYTGSFHHDFNIYVREHEKTCHKLKQEFFQHSVPLTNMPQLLQFISDTLTIKFVWKGIAKITTALSFAV